MFSQKGRSTFNKESDVDRLFEEIPQFMALAAEGSATKGGVIKMFWRSEIQEHRYLQELRTLGITEIGRGKTLGGTEQKVENFKI